MAEEREVLAVDVLFVGGGVAGLSSAIHLADLAAKSGRDDISIAVLDKGSYPGAHAVSGAVMDPCALKELIPDFIQRGAPVEGVVEKEQVFFLTPKKKIRFPFVPPPMENRGHYVVSIAKLTEWMAQIAEGKGVDIFTGFSATQVLFDGNRVVGVRTGDKGIGKDNHPRANFESGIDLQAKVTVFAEGSRGNLTKTLIKKLKLDDGNNPQNYVLGIKEVWEIAPGRIRPGDVVHTMGYPHKNHTYGGGFIYGMNENRIAIGLLTGLDYSDPGLDPHAEFQKFKLHPFLSDLISGGKILQYGAKTTPVGGYFAIPRIHLDGAVLIGDSAGLFISQKIKGLHSAMASGILAAESIMEALLSEDFSASKLKSYQETVYSSNFGNELYKSRNFHQLFRKGLFIALLTAGMQFLFGGRIIKSRLHSEHDHSCLKTDKNMRGTFESAKRGIPSPINDGVITFDKETDVYYSGTSHEENQPSHLKIGDLSICYDKCLGEYNAPCVRFCPANVYEMTTDADTYTPSLKIQHSNCLHCKTCDIKCPYENITWLPPEGGDGPKYSLV